MVDAVVDAEVAPLSLPGRGERAAVGVVVTHGFTGNPRATRPLGRALAGAGYRVEVPRLPGHGTHHRDLGATRYADWYGEVDAAVTRLGTECERIVLVGHSMGGTISLDLAARRPDDVTAVVPICAQVLDRTEFLARIAPLLQHVIPYVPRDLAGLPTDDIARPGVDEGAYAMVPAKAAQSILRELPRIRATLPTLRQPVLVVSAPNDRTVDPRNSRHIVELLAGTDVRELVCERSYHVVPLDYDAELLTERVLDFVRDVTGS